MADLNKTVYKEVIDGRSFEIDVLLDQSDDRVATFNLFEVAEDDPKGDMIADFCFDGKYQEVTKDELHNAILEYV